MVRKSLLLLTFALAAVSISAFQYGRHIPQGESAVNYIYGPEGTWKSIQSLNYRWNYYEQWATQTHPYDKSALINEANGSQMFTARDANGYLLCDFNRDLEIEDDAGKCAFAFHEHSGNGVNGINRGNPFTQFWLDDNWLARYMSQAYSRPLPDGLVDQPGKFIRWKPIGGDISAWQPYGSNHFDTLSLDGLFYIQNNQVNAALSKWTTALGMSAAAYDQENQQYKYPGIEENYHIALWKILTDMLLATSNLSDANRDLLIQHSVSLRSQILENQQRNSRNEPIGWISNIGEVGSLINTESVSCGALALGADAKFVFEADRAPMEFYEEYNFFIRPYHAVSAVMGLSSQGFLSSGPNWAFPVGRYVAEFVLRTNALPELPIAQLFVYDAVSRQNLAYRNVNAKDITVGANKWSALAVEFEVTSAQNSLDFQTFWTGFSNLDIAYVKIK